MEADGTVPMTTTRRYVGPAAELGACASKLNHRSRSPNAPLTDGEDLRGDDDCLLGDTWSARRAVWTAGIGPVGAGRGNKSGSAACCSGAVPNSDRMPRTWQVIATRERSFR